MTTKEIEDRIRKIKALANDPEAAHSAEDDLRSDFIEYVSTLRSPIAEKAKLVMSTAEIMFGRWCA